MLSSLHVHVCMSSSASFSDCDMDCFGASAQFFWRVVMGITHCPVVTAQETAQFETPVMLVQEPMIGFRDNRLQVSSFGTKLIFGLSFCLIEVLVDDWSNTCICCRGVQRRRLMCSTCILTSGMSPYIVAVIQRVGLTLPKLCTCGNMAN